MSNDGSKYPFAAFDFTDDFIYINAHMYILVFIKKSQYADLRSSDVLALFGFTYSLVYIFTYAYVDFHVSESVFHPCLALFSPFKRIFTLPCHHAVGV